MNLTSQSETLVYGTLCNRIISLKSRRVIFMASWFSSQGIKCATLNNRSATTKIDSTFCSVFGKAKNQSTTHSSYGLIIASSTILLIWIWIISSLMNNIINHSSKLSLVLKDVFHSFIISNHELMIVNPLVDLRKDNRFGHHVKHVIQPQ